MPPPPPPLALPAIELDCIHSFFNFTLCCTPFRVQFLWLDSYLPGELSVPCVFVLQCFFCLFWPVAHDSFLNHMLGALQRFLDS